ncbi:hypothetical protein L596_012465 [Steinernema carpocapsae]|uniref:Uncharacterized protein n=1 Tax=Steinernema carpocapsae TaxID=34508 RepID=A0A4U5NXR4_STECR|nr:hypothetical protein L596_012465 [Steinernema carpocapsae]
MRPLAGRPHSFQVSAYGQPLRSNEAPSATHAKAMDRQILLLFVLPLGVVAEANRCDGISWKYKVDFYLRPCWITAYFNGVPLNLAASEHFKCNLEHPTDVYKTCKFLAGYKGYRFCIEYRQPRLNAIDGKVIDTISVEPRYVAKPSHLLVADGHFPWPVYFTNSEDVKPVLMEYFTFYNHTLYYAGRKWLDVPLPIPPAMKLTVLQEKEISLPGWTPGALVDPANGSVHIDTSLDPVEKKLIQVIKGKKVFRKLCKPSDNREKVEKLKFGEETLIVNRPDELFCYFIDDCEVAYGPATLLKDFIVVPTNVIRFPIPLESPSGSEKHDASASIAKESPILFGREFDVAKFSIALSSLILVVVTINFVAASFLLFTYCTTRPRPRKKKIGVSTEARMRSSTKMTAAPQIVAKLDEAPTQNTSTVAASFLEPEILKTAEKTHIETQLEDDKTTLETLQDFRKPSDPAIIDPEYLDLTMVEEVTQLSSKEKIA